MVFKIERLAPQTPEYSEYVKNKIDTAAAVGVIYELEDEDKRIDLLFKDTRLYHEKSLLSLDRVMVNGKEQLVAAVEYSFYDNESGTRTDRFIDYIGRMILPNKYRDSRTGLMTVSPNGIYSYSEPFTPANVDKFLSQYPLAPNFEFRFYPGTTVTTRQIQPVEVKRKEFFKFATWEELFIGKEKRYTSSTLNKLSSLRKEVDYDERQQYETPRNDIEEPVLSKPNPIRKISRK